MWEAPTQLRSRASAVTSCYVWNCSNVRTVATWVVGCFEDIPRPHLVERLVEQCLKSSTGTCFHGRVVRVSLFADSAGEGLSEELS